jgi:hypothetical protein
MVTDGGSPIQATLSTKIARHQLKVGQENGQGRRQDTQKPLPQPTSAVNYAQAGR